MCVLVVDYMPQPTQSVQIRFKPLKNLVVVQVIDDYFPVLVKEKTKRKQVVAAQGKIIQIGPHSMSKDAWTKEVDVVDFKVGDSVLFKPSMPPIQLNTNQGEYLLMEPQDIIAVLEP